MYEGKAYIPPYRPYLFQRRKKRTERRKRIVTCAVTFCLLTSAVCALHRTPLLKISAYNGTQPSDSGSDISLNEAQPSDSGSDILSNEQQSFDSTQKNAVIGEAPFDDTENDSPVIFLDPGHGGIDEGCSFTGIQEKEINLSIARIVQTKLNAMGYGVILSRDGDSYIAKEDRVINANNANADIYISIHQNSSEDSTVNGMEVWYDGTDKERDSRRLALLIHQQTLKSTDAAKRELRSDADFHVTGSTSMPACLIETGFLSNRQELARLCSPEYQEQIAEGIAQGIEYYFHPKTMYLTFDDGPSEENTTRVLDILKERNIKATFFLIGENVLKHPEIAKRIAAEGHTIGIHCNVHDYRALYQSVDSYRKDFETAHQIIYETTGVDTRLFRFPGGSINAFNKAAGSAIIQEMTNLGYIYFDWNASLEDAVGESTPQQLIDNGVETTLGRRTVIMLAHDVVYNTGICLEELLDQLAEYEMLPLSEDVEPIRF